MRAGFRVAQVCVCRGSLRESVGSPSPAPPLRCRCAPWNNATASLLQPVSADQNREVRPSGNLQRRSLSIPPAAYARRSAFDRDRRRPRLDYKPEPAPKGVVVNNTEEDWVARDGRFWNTLPACAAPPGTVVFEAGGGDIPELALPDGYLTYDQAARLPTDPAGLTAWLARHGQTGDLIVTDLTNLLWEAVPPGVRAAAFRALAALPGAKNLGPGKGGQSLLIPLAAVPWMKLVVDPKTSLVHSEAFAGKPGYVAVEISQWTNHLPRVVPVGPKSSCH